jgi:CxxC motif-containing protein (DUF1111 family)
MSCRHHRDGSFSHHAGSGPAGPPRFWAWLRSHASVRSDFLLHDIGTGDGTVILGSPQSSANKLRTQPLWGVRMRNRLMHDGESRTFTEAILRHGGEASDVKNSFLALTDAQKAQLIKFLKSL